MGDDELAMNPAVAGSTSLNRIGGVSALALVVAYVVIIALYVSVGAPPVGAQAWLADAAGETTTWWAILALSVLTDGLLIPIVLALFFALRSVSRSALLLGTAFVGLFVVLDLAVTWPNYAALITLATDHAEATTDAQQVANLAAATYASAVVSSPLDGVYSILTLSIGILMIAGVMFRSAFGRTTALVGIATGVLGILSVVGPLVASGVGQLVIVASVLTTVWVALVGYRLLRLPGRGALLIRPAPSS